MTLIERMYGRALELGFNAYHDDMRELLKEIRTDLPRAVLLAANEVPLHRRLDGDVGKASFYVSPEEAQDVWTSLIDAALAEG